MYVVELVAGYTISITGVLTGGVLWFWLSF